MGWGGSLSLMVTQGMNLSAQLVIKQMLYTQRPVQVMKQVGGCDGEWGGAVDFFKLILNNHPTDLAPSCDHG